MITGTTLSETYMMRYQVTQVVLWRKQSSKILVTVYVIALLINNYMTTYVNNVQYVQL